MKNIISVFVLTLLLTISGNVLAHCGDKASDHQTHDDSKDKKEKDKDKG
jgi:hypothetical protein